MAQLTYVGQGGQAAHGPWLNSLMLLVSLVFVLLGIKIWGFRRRLTFDSGGRTTTTRSTQQQTQTAPRYAAYESQVNGTDSAVHGVFRQRNTEEFESARPTNSTANKYLTGSVPNLQLTKLAPYAYKEETSIPELAGTVPYRPEPQAARRRRREVHSASYEYYSTPPTRQPPAPPIAVAAAEPPSQLDIPNFDHFAEKYKLISAKASSKEPKEHGRYVKYEQVDDVPELLTPDDDQVGAAISVAAQVHHVPAVIQTQTEHELSSEAEPVPDTVYNSRFLELEHADSAFVVEIIDGTPDSIEQTDPVMARNLFDNLEMPQHMEDAEFERIRSTYEMNEADILDMQPDFAELATQLPAPSSPPGFGKSIDDDWENFENLEIVTDVPQSTWSVLDPSCTEQIDETNIDLENVVQQESLFQELELIAPADGQQTGRQQITVDSFEPPPYDMEPPILPILPDYESLMQLEGSQNNKNLPKYADVVGKGKGKGKENDAKYVSSIEDLFVELQVNGEPPTGNSLPLAEEVHNFEELCEELEIAASPVPARRPPQPAPRVSKPATLNVRGDAPPLTCYEREELPSSSSSEAEVEEIAIAPPLPAAPQPTKRIGRTLKVRFDVDNLQYYQSAEVPSSNESDVEFESADEQEKPQLPSRSTQRLIPLLPDEPSPNAEPDVPRLFGTQVSLEDSDDEAFGRAIRQHRSMTDALRPVFHLDRTAQGDRITEA
ncbi:uncharacterized protein LOC115768579 [Drosophila novamexicana]|uniref:uncharacterized protein LOC115768579 n=1 Tax=Drosophila novamexicana TaxID=47314 RepID=UPI0011E606BC|nr:uncharacterized protein LOC115768579 [Drosophila novamexicana]